MSKSLLVMFCLVIGLIVLACGGPTNQNATNTAVPANTRATSAASPAPTVAAAGEKVGVAECDTFIDSYEACVKNNVPEAARAQFNATLKTWRTEWKKLADNPQTRGTLASVCKTHLETARTQMKAYKCTF